MYTVCFVHYLDKIVAQTQMFGVHYMPVWIYTLASYSEGIPDVGIKMFDSRVQEERELPDADLYLFTGINQDYEAIFSFLKRARQMRPNAKFVLGGPICWSYQQAGRVEKLFDFDHIVIGDGEPVIVGIVTKLKSKQTLPKVLTWDKKFEVEKSINMDRPLLNRQFTNITVRLLKYQEGVRFCVSFVIFVSKKTITNPTITHPSKSLKRSTTSLVKMYFKFFLLVIIFWVTPSGPKRSATKL